MKSNRNSFFKDQMDTAKRETRMRQMDDLRARTREKLAAKKKEEKRLKKERLTFRNNICSQLTPELERQFMEIIISKEGIRNCYNNPLSKEQLWKIAAPLLSQITEEDRQALQIKKENVKLLHELTPEQRKEYYIQLERKIKNDYYQGIKLTFKESVEQDRTLIQHFLHIKTEANGDFSDNKTNYKP